MFRRFATRPVALLAAAVVTAALSLGLPLAAQASWCFDDPEITVNGQPITIVDGVATDVATARQDILAANITVTVPVGAVVKVVSVTNTYWPQTIKVVYSGSYTAGKPLMVNATTTFTLAKGTPALASTMHMTWHTTQTTDATATVQGPLVRVINVQP